MTYGCIEYEELGAVARIWFNRPEARNAQNQQLLDELDDAMVRAGRDPAINVVIMAGRGGHFSSGHDLREGPIKRPNPTVESRWDFEMQHYYDYCMRIFDLPKPVIAQVEGACIAAGYMIANMADLIVCSEDASFGDPVGHSLAGAAVEVLVHPWVMGARQAKEFLFTGQRMDAATAQRIGMVNRVVLAEQLEEETLALARQIAKAPPFAIKLIKRSVNRTLDIQGFRNAVHAHFDTHQLGHTSAEAAQIREERQAALKAGGKLSFGRQV